MTSQFKVTKQILFHWQPFRDFKFKYVGSRQAEQLRSRSQQRVVTTVEESVAIRSWILPLPPHGCLCPSKKQSWSGSCKDGSFTYSLNLYGAPIISRTHTQPSHSQTSRLLTSSLSINPVYARRVDSSGLVFSLSSHRHSYIGLVFSSLFID
jgi:hypothetical protein